MPEYNQGHVTINSNSPKRSIESKQQHVIVSDDQVGYRTFRFLFGIVTLLLNLADELDKPESKEEAATRRGSRRPPTMQGGDSQSLTEPPFVARVTVSIKRCVSPPAWRRARRAGRPGA